VRGGGEATRQAILEAARELFGARAYEQVGLRDIAAAAGATAALVNRYFGTKEQLFREVLESGKPYFFERLLSDHAHFGESVARIIVYGDGGRPTAAAVTADATGGDTPETSPTSAAPAPGNVSYVVHSLGNPIVADMVREVLEREAVPRLAEWLGGPNAALRAEMVFACFAGVHAMRQVVGTTALKAAGAEQLIAVLAPMLQACADSVPATG
jgi:AcrR family transcriptional regulator